MSSRQLKNSGETGRVPPATTPKARENQLIAMAIDLAEKQIREGTASSQTINHFLKLGSSREELEQIRLDSENALLKVKAEALESQKRTEEMFVNAIAAFRAYSGQDQPEGDLNFHDD